MRLDIIAKRTHGTEGGAAVARVDGDAVGVHRADVARAGADLNIIGYRRLRLANIESHSETLL